MGRPADSGNDAFPSRYADRIPGSAPSSPFLIFPHLLSIPLSSPCSPSYNSIMKSLTLLTASALLGVASAEVHKLKLTKVPLDEQLVR